MKKKTDQPNNPRESLGLPGGLYAVDETFPTVEQMDRAIDAFLHYLHKIYEENESPGETPNLFGFIVKKLKICRDPSIQEVEIWSDFGRGVAVVHAPELPGETIPEWNARRDQILGTYWPTLQDAQIRATVQLYRTLSIEARRRLEDQFNRSCQQSEPNKQ